MTTLTQRPDGTYHIDHPDAHPTTKVWVAPASIPGRGRVPCAYLEPSGAVPGGLFFPVEHVSALLDAGTIAVYYYERDAQGMADIEAEGIAFDIVGEPESREEARNLAIIEDLADLRG